MRYDADADVGAYRLEVEGDALRDAPPFRPDAVSGWDPTYWRTSVYDFHAPHAERPWWR